MRTPPTSRAQLSNIAQLSDTPVHPGTPAQPCITSRPGDSPNYPQATVQADATARLGTDPLTPIPQTQYCQSKWACAAHTSDGP